MPRSTRHHIQFVLSIPFFCSISASPLSPSFLPVASFAFLNLPRCLPSNPLLRPFKLGGAAALSLPPSLSHIYHFRLSLSLSLSVYSPSLILPLSSSLSEQLFSSRSLARYERSLLLDSRRPSLSLSLPPSLYSSLLLGPSVVVPLLSRTQRETEGGRGRAAVR